MQVTIRIQCHSCGNTAEFYFYQRKTNELFKCPFCYAEMSHQPTKRVLDAAGEYADALGDLLKHSTGCDDPLFQFDLTTTYVSNEQIERIHGIRGD